LCGLSPIEQPPPGNEGGLALATGAVRDLEVLDTPVGRIAIVISKDAWMVDVNDRFAAKGANVILQPEAFSAWAYAAAPWEPDTSEKVASRTCRRTPASW
jgi:predicted amidohydrolase